MVVKTSGLYVGLGKYYVIAACFNSVLKFPVHLLVGESVNCCCRLMRAKGKGYGNR